MTERKCSCQCHAVGLLAIAETSLYALAFLIFVVGLIIAAKGK